MQARERLSEALLHAAPRTLRSWSLSYISAVAVRSACSSSPGSSCTHAPRSKITRLFCGCSWHWPGWHALLLRHTHWGTDREGHAPSTQSGLLHSAAPAYPAAHLCQQRVLAQLEHGERDTEEHLHLWPDTVSSPGRSLSTARSPPARDHSEHLLMCAAMPPPEREASGRASWHVVAGYLGIPWRQGQLVEL